ARAEKRRGDVDGQRLVPVVERDVLGVLVGGDAGVVNQHVEAPEGLDRLFEQRDDRVFFSEVGRQRQRFAAFGFDAAATSSSRAARRATSTVFAPSAANSSAMPRPMPLLAPVTIAILPWSCPAILYSRSRKCHYSRKVRHGHNRLFGCATGRRAWSRVSSFWD